MKVARQRALGTWFDHGVSPTFRTGIPDFGSADVARSVNGDLVRPFDRVERSIDESFGPVRSEHPHLAWHVSFDYTRSQHRRQEHQNGSWFEQAENAMIVFIVDGLVGSNLS